MARIRSVHPDICLSATMAAIPASLERTFVRLWTHCDDEGRCVDNPRLIKAALYPLHDEQTWQVVDRELDDLEDAGLIYRYEVNGERFLQVRSWGEYQKPQKPRPSPLPPLPDGYAKPTRTVPERYASGEGEGEGVGEGDIAPAAQNENGRVLTEIKDTLVELFGEPAPQNWSLYNRVATWIRNQGGTPEDVRYRAGRILQEWGPKAATVTSLEKHWNRYTAQVGQISDADVEKFAREQKRQQRMLEAAELERRLPG